MQKSLSLTPETSILVTALQFVDANVPGSDLVNTLLAPGTDATVFAPTNAAFGQLAADLGFTGDTTDEDAVVAFIVGALPAETIRDVILYHVTPGSQLAADVAAATTLPTLLGPTIGVDLPTLVDNEPDLPDPSLAATDIVASNGVVHLIDRVLLPVDLPDNDAPTLTGIVAASGGTFDNNPEDFDLLLNAVITAGLDGVLDDPNQDLTVFAPNDAAFIATAQALGFDGSDEAGAFDYIVEALTLLGKGDPLPLLTEILTYHVAPESLQASQVLAAGTVATLQGGTLSVDGATLAIADADPDLPDPTLIATDIQASNGIAHVIDGVLLPVDILQSDGSNDVDFIIGTDKSEKIRTKRDNDFVDGNGGNDLILLGSGDDVGLGGSGRDVVSGWRGNDFVSGGDGYDRVYGGRGDDTVDGGAGHDKVFGGSGNDIVSGGTGNDWVSLGRGHDTFVFEAGDGHDKIFDFNTHQDVIDLSSYGFGGFEDIAGSIHRGWFRTTLELGDGDGITFLGRKHFDADDFIF